MKRKELLEIGQIWYDRADKLAHVMMDTKNDVKKRDKAFELHFELSNRLMRIVNRIGQINAPKFQEGGKVISKGGIATKLQK